MKIVQKFKSLGAFMKNYILLHGYKKFACYARVLAHQKRIVGTLSADYFGSYIVLCRKHSGSWEYIRPIACRYE